MNKQKARPAAGLLLLLLSHPKGDLGFLLASPTPAGGAPPAWSC